MPRSDFNIPQSPLISALLCAIQVLKGNDGDYSPHEKHEAIEQLQLLLAEKEKLMADAQFYQQLHDFLAEGSEGLESTVPLFRNDDGTIDREKTLALPCYANFKKE